MRMAADKAQRKELLAQYRQSGPRAGVYRFVNRRSGRVLLGATLNLGSMRGKLDFAHATGSPSALDRRLHQDAREFGVDVFELEVLEELETTPEMTTEQVREDLTALEALWRERLADAPSY
jgi:hypothetical protein